MKILVVYICVSLGRRSAEFAERFVRTYQEFPGESDHNLIVVFNGGKPHPSLSAVFNPIPHGFHERSNEGWDIGAYQDVASRVNPDLLVCLGEATYFHRAGWLARLAYSATRYGRGMYGAYSSLLVSAHLNTTSFACSPEFIRKYSDPVKTRADRYNFEHGFNSMWRRIAFLGYPTKLVTWDGEWDPQDWRKPPNILWRGDQSNCLTFCQHTDRWNEAPLKVKEAWSKGADGLAVIQEPRHTVMADVA